MVNTQFDLLTPIIIAETLIIFAFIRLITLLQNQANKYLVGENEAN